MWTADDELIEKIGGGKHGFNAIETDSNGNALDETQCMDDFLHGTHCAGIIGAEWNGYGVSGIAKGAKLMAVKVIDNTGHFGANNHVLEGLEYISNAISAGVNVRAVNISLRGNFQSLSINKMIKHLGEQGVVVCVCSGNETTDNDKTSCFASSLKYIDNAVVVNASNRNGELAYFSNYGATTTDIAAPGVDIYSTYPINKKKPSANLMTADWIEDFEDSKNIKIDYKGESDNVTATLDNTVGYNNSTSSIKVHHSDLNNTTDQKVILGPITLEDDITTFSCAIKPSNISGKINVNPLVPVVDEEGNIQFCKSEYTNCTEADDGWYILRIELPHNVERDKFGIVIECNDDVDTSEISSLVVRDFNIDNICLNKSSYGYEFDDGTSMATPVVTGEAAILAKAFPNDNADKIAARIIGSARTSKNLASTSVSGGIADIHKALTEDYVPVINRADADENGKTVTISGYFFGDKQGTLNIGGTEFKVTSWSDEKIVAIIPNNFKLGDAYVKVSGINGSSCQNVTIDKVVATKSYEQLKISNDSTGFAKLKLIGMAGLNDKIYLLSNNEYFESILVWCYDIKNKNWTKIKEDSSKVPYNLNGTNVCTYGNNLMIGVGKGIALFDTKTNKWSYHKLNICESSTIVNTGTDIYSLGGMDDKENYYDTIYHIDLKNNTAKKIGAISKACAHPIVTYSATGELYAALGLTNYDIINTLEKITITNSKATSKIVNKKLIDDKINTDTYDYDNCSGFASLDGKMRITGPYMWSERKVDVEADTFDINYTDPYVPSSTGIVSSTEIIKNSIACAYDNAYYAIAKIDNNKLIFTVDKSVKTIPEKKPDDSSNSSVVDSSSSSSDTDSSKSDTSSADSVTHTDNPNTGIDISIITPLTILGGALFVWKKRKDNSNK